MRFVEIFGIEVDEAVLSRISVNEERGGVGGARAWIPSPGGLVRWLGEHPEARAEISYWALEISSPNPDDVVGLDQYDPPSELDSSVESFDTDKRDGLFSACWAFC